MSQLEVSNQEEARQTDQGPIDVALSERIAEIFQAMADPNRLRIISLLAFNETSVGDLSKAVGMSESATSHQLRILRALRIVRSRKDGRVVFYTLDDDHVRDMLDRAVAHVRHLS